MAIKAKKVKVSGRERNRLRIRKKVFGSLERPRVSVFKSSKHMYAQVVNDINGETLASASTRDEVVRQRAAQGGENAPEGSSKSTKSVRAAWAVGLILGERCKEKKIEQVVYDRSGYIYHGRVKALADGAREAGLKF